MIRSLLPWRPKDLREFEPFHGDLNLNYFRTHKSYLEYEHGMFESPLLTFMVLVVSVDYSLYPAWWSSLEVALQHPPKKDVHLKKSRGLA